MLRLSEFLYSNTNIICRALCDVCDQQNIIHDLNPADWELLSVTRDVFAPFAAAVTRLEGENYATLSEVYPVLFSLKEKLGQVRCQVLFT